MPKVYCQNNLCSFWRKSKKFKNYGTCKKRYSLFNIAK